jgi:hypothetical protein
MTIGGTNYRLSKFTIPLYQEFVQWAKSKLPDPYEGLAERCKGLSPELAKYIIDKAEQRAINRGKLNDPEIEDVANSLEGVKKMCSLLFRKHHPNLSEADVLNLLEQGIAEHGEDFFAERLNVAKGSSDPNQ